MQIISTVRCSKPQSIHPTHLYHHGATPISDGILIMSIINITTKVITTTLMRYLIFILAGLYGLSNLTVPATRRGGEILFR